MTESSSNSLPAAALGTAGISSAITADEFLHALAQMDAAMAQVVRRAGQGCGPDCTDVVTDVIDAARRVLTAADPSAPLMMLTMARQTLAAVVHRQAARATRKVA